MSELETMNEVEDFTGDLSDEALDREEWSIVCIKQCYSGVGRNR